MILGFSDVKFDLWWFLGLVFSWELGCHSGTELSQPSLQVHHRLRLVSLNPHGLRHRLWNLGWLPQISLLRNLSHRLWLRTIVDMMWVLSRRGPCLRHRQLVRPATNWFRLQRPQWSITLMRISKSTATWWLWHKTWPSFQIQILGQFEYFLWRSVPSLIQAFLPI